MVCETRSSVSVNEKYAHLSSRRVFLVSFLLYLTRKKNLVLSFEDFPNEIQQQVFGYLRNKTSDIRQRILVCKSWRNRYEKELYSNVVLNNFPQLLSFLDTLEESQYLSSLVVQLTIKFEEGPRDIHENCAVGSLFTHLVNLERISFSGGLYYRALSDALLFGNLPNLTYLDTDYDDDETNDYATCVIILRNRLKNLRISEWADDWDGRIGFARFIRLFNVLDGFKKVETLSVQSKCEQKIELIEKVTRDCPLLQDLTLRFTGNDPMEEFSKLLNSMVMVPTFDPAYNVNKLKLQGCFLNNLEILPYIVGKFPRLKNLEIIGQVAKIRHLDDQILKAFLSYLSNIGNVNVTKIPCNEATVMVSIDSYWKTMAPSHAINVGFRYDFEMNTTVDQMNVEIKPKTLTNSFHYACSEDSGLQHLGVLETQGDYIEDLKFTGVDTQLLDSEDPDEITLFKALIIEPLENCAKLKRLTALKCNLTGSSKTNYTISKRAPLNSLHIVNCTIDSSFFQKLSKQFDRLGYLQVHILKLASKPKDRNAGFKEIKMPDTVLGTLSLSTDPNRVNEKDERVVLVKISTLKKQTCYMYDFNTMNSLKFKTIDEESFEKESKLAGSLTMNISCKSLRFLRVTQLKRLITLKVI